MTDITEKQRAAKTAYMRLYRAKNREKVREYERNYVRKDKAALKGHHKEWRDRKTAIGINVTMRKRGARGKDLEVLAGRPKPEFCEACGDPPGRKGMHFDHDHQRGHFRGWLCSGCNVTLGHVKDDPNRLRKLIAYLERTADGTGPQLALPGV